MDCPDIESKCSYIKEKLCKIFPIKYLRATNKVQVLSEFSPSQKVNVYTLQQLLKNIVLTAQYLALLPVEGITKDTKDLTFKWFSVKTIYVIITIVSQTSCTLVLLFFSNIETNNFFGYEVIIWNIRGSLGVIIFLKLARNWPRLLRQWNKVETEMLHYGPLPSLKLRFQILSILFLITGLFEHLLFVCGGVIKVLSKMEEGENFFQKYFELLYPEFFGIIGYNHLKAVLVEFLAIITTFVWQFSDLLIILLSSALAERFRQITKKIKAKQDLTDLQWRDIRKQFNTLALLCKTLNSTVSEVILLSFFGNVYFLSVSIFQCFTPRTTYEGFYFWYSIVFTAFHFICVCIYSSWVNEESLKPLSEILMTPVKNISYEIDRLLYQMAEGDIAIYGCGLFKITRSTVLSVTSIVLTLQLIFVQFKAQMPSNIV